MRQISEITQSISFPFIVFIQEQWITHHSKSLSLSQSLNWLSTWWNMIFTCLNNIRKQLTIIAENLLLCLSCVPLKTPQNFSPSNPVAINGCLIPWGLSDWSPVVYLASEWIVDNAFLCGERRGMTWQNKRGVVQVISVNVYSAVTSVPLNIDTRSHNSRQNQCSRFWSTIYSSFSSRQKQYLWTHSGTLFFYMHIFTYTCTLTEHLIRSIILILGRARVCSQNSHSSLWYRFYKMLGAYFWEWAFILQISLSTISKKCSVGFRSDDWSTLNSLSCSWNLFEVTSALWHGALSCWK